MFMVSLVFLYLDCGLVGCGEGKGFGESLSEVSWGLKGGDGI